MEEKISIHVKVAEIVDPNTFEEVKVVRVNDFCRAVNISNNQFHRYRSEGNGKRCIKTYDMSGTFFVPIEEIYDFQFPVKGRPGHYYRYDENGEKVYED